MTLRCKSVGAALALILALSACASDGKSDVPPPPEADAPSVDEEPPESVLGDLVIPEPRVTVTTGDTANLLAGAAEPESVDATETGVADPSAEAHVSDGVALVTLGAGLLDAAQCVVLLLDLDDGIESAQVGEGCDEASEVVGLPPATVAGQAYASEDGTVVVFPFTLGGGAFGLSLLVPVPTGGGYVTLAGGGGVGDEPVPKAEIPADAQAGLVVDAPGISADGVEVFPYPVI